jgi:glutathione synthase/RimK-type ligase-like ATP-grasp enzyme
MKRKKPEAGKKTAKKAEKKTAKKAAGEKAPAKRTLLAVGDEKDFDSYKKFCREKKLFAGTRLIFKSVNWATLLRGRVPGIKTDDVIIFPFFPFAYWDRNIETKSYKGIYGNETFHEKFRQFWARVEKTVERTFAGRNVVYVNHPRMLSWSRDKELAKKLVSKAGVLIPRTFHTRNIDEILRLVKRRCRVFIKVRYGSMGKGITYLEKDRWLTNFRFRNGKITSRRSDYGWTFADVTDKERFLVELLKKDVIVEEAVESALVDGRKCDLRIYVANRRVLYVYGRTNDPDAVTTNISQGGRGEDPSFEKKLSAGQLATAKEQAVRALDALGLRFGGVDMALSWDRRSAIFIEANAFPGFPKVKAYNLSRDIIAELVREHGV